MTEKSVVILETALYYSLWVFLGSFLFLMVFALLRLKRSRYPVVEEPDEDKPPWNLTATPEQLAITWRALTISLILSALSYIALVLTPLPFIDNFVNSESWKLRPLRVTALTYERFHDGFSLNGEVWNQTEETLTDVQVVIQVWGTDDELLDEVLSKIDPTPLTSKSPGHFRIRYEKNSALLLGYKVLFTSQDGVEIPHSQGFDVQ